MDGKRVRVALVGSGVTASRYHYPSLSFPDVELVGIADLFEDKARETAARFGIPGEAAEEGGHA